MDLYLYRFLTVQLANNHWTVREHRKFKKRGIEDNSLQTVTARKYKQLLVRPSRDLIEDRMLPPGQNEYDTPALPPTAVT